MRDQYCGQVGGRERAVGERWERGENWGKGDHGKREEGVGSLRSDEAARDDACNSVPDICFMKEPMTEYTSAHMDTHLSIHTTFIHTYTHTHAYTHPHTHIGT
eukprot:GHVU01066902.1.p4 GENE.GHVU01066902.1~~GHVU01066902.1.p4  ORF type:complete len:103 (+),score=10.27 GHVU01066902.1:166-474(+)